MSTLFWICVLLILFAYVGYPLLLYFLARFWPRPVRRANIFPRTTIILAAHNEQENLGRKLENLDQLDYPADQLEIVVVSDGSTDLTNKILKAWEGPSRRAVILPTHQGKASALNSGIYEARSEIIIFTDARQILAPDSVKNLVANFADPTVGCVSGDIILGDPAACAPINGLGAYWQMETLIRRWEGALGCLIGAAGCLYAVRKSLVAPFPVGTILDDVYLPVNIARHGKKVVFESTARGWDCPHDDQGREFRRKIRTITGNYQLICISPWLLTTRNPVRLQFFCHKVLRLLAPLAFTCLLISSLLTPGAFYRGAFVLQVCGYGSAILALLRPKFGVISRVGDFALAFLILNVAAIVALVYFVTGKKQVWAR